MTETIVQAGKSRPVPVVLVVEAEPVLLMTATDTVERMGFEAVEARSAAEAVAILEKRPDIRIVFTDIDMPNGLDGMKLAACIRDRWPPIEIILTSAGVAPAKIDLPKRSVFLKKPYTSRMLADAILKMAA